VTTAPTLPPSIHGEESSSLQDKLDITGGTVKQISGGSVLLQEKSRNGSALYILSGGDGMRNLACELLPIPHGSLPIIEALFLTISLAETSRPSHSLFPLSAI
jgi:hypothetical protein